MAILLTARKYLPVLNNAVIIGTLTTITTAVLYLLVLANAS
jgi:hypothetical protein